MNKMYNLKEAKLREFENFLVKELELTNRQIDILKEDSIIKYSPYYIYEKKQELKSNFLIRLSILIFPFWFFILFCGLPFNWIITKSWGYPNNIAEALIGKWANKLGLKY